MVAQLLGRVDLQAPEMEVAQKNRCIRFPEIIRYTPTKEVFESVDVFHRGYINRKIGK